MPKKTFNKTDQPTKSVRVSKTAKPNKALTTEQQLEYDLKQDEKNEAKLKEVIKSKGYKAKKINKYIEKIVGKFDPKIVHINNLVSKGKDLISIRINENKFENRSFTLNKIKSLSDKLSQYLNKKDVNGKQMTSLLYGELNWKSGYLRDFGTETKLYNPNDLYNLEIPFEEPKTIKSFNIYIALGNKPTGGNDDKFNDCLFNCLKYFVFDIETYFKSAAELKKFLKLKRDDKVPLSCIDLIEKKLKTYQINIRGDFIRSSTVSGNKEINIILKDEHYSVEKINRNLLQGVPRFEEKTPIMVGNFEAYDGNKKWIMTKEEERSIHFNYKSPYIIIPRDKYSKDLSIEVEYEQFIKIADTLKKESKGMVNLYKSGNYRETALALFDRITKFINPEPILQDEAEWIKLSSFSALIWCETYEGPLYKYDVKSLYPSLMNSTTLKFPVKRGEFKLLENFDKEYFDYGIYRCKITKSDDETINKLFKCNFHNYYTSIDLTNAKQLGLKIELIQDNKPNFLYWSRDKTITFQEVFKNYVNILFPLKENKVDKAKYILNLLWGALSQVDKRKQYIEKQFKIEEDEEICEIYPSSTEDDKHIIKTTKFNSYYKTSFARLCPFIISQGRKIMSNIMFKHRDCIHRIQTDGFVSSKPIIFNTDVKLGELKYEGYCENGIITNCINDPGEFIVYNKLY